MISRRDVLKLSGAAAVSAALPALAQDSVPPDYRLEIAPVTVDLSPHHKVRTVAYNGEVPGPLLRLKEGRPVTIDVTNHTDRPEVVHWHGLFLPVAVDGSMEEGTPPIAANTTARLTFTPRPAGFRWYHTHTMAMGDLTRSQYGGQHGWLMIEPREQPGRYDQEFFLALHDWGGHLLASDDGAMNPVYEIATVNGKMLGAGEPLRVRQGQRILLHVLNSSPTEVHWLALAGHELRVLALDGNPVPSPQVVPILRLAPAERVCALVEMNNPGVWVLGEVRRHVQAAGMGIVVEYAGQGGTPRWQQPADLIWSYAQFASAQPGPEPTQSPTIVPLVFESKFRGHGAMEAWTINGKSYPDSGVAPLEQGGRYRLQFINKSGDAHPLHLHRHSFELRSLGAPLAATRGSGPNSLRGILKDVVLVDSHTTAEVEFTADNPGDTLFHCHQQDHMDLGFMMLFHYA
ncbi:MAG TPA: multicopper oxidase domain-containing protein [Steroidobacteraceae bacterium]|nr:multicopper oxidase domain-containing protein [Steroidobacteraceae bacterium]